MKDRIKGKAQEVQGRVTHSRKKVAEGKARQVIGNVKSGVKEIQHDAERKRA